MLLLHLTTNLNFPSSTELMLGAITGTAAGIGILIGIDRFANRKFRGKRQEFGLKKRTSQ